MVLTQDALRCALYFLLQLQTLGNHCLTDINQGQWCACARACARACVCARTELIKKSISLRSTI